jgi:anti-sigma regulatory factor (Ser/Thr protein kinase)
MRALKTEKKNRKKPKKRRKKHYEEKPKKSRNTNPHHPNEIFAPEIFSIINNREDFMNFYHQVDNRVWHKKPVYIDLSRVTTITPDGLLCVIASMANYHAANKYGLIKGNSPTDPHCKQIFLESGFYKYVSSAFQHVDTENVLSIRNDEMVNPEEAKAIIQFIRNKLHITKIHTTRAIYATIMEAMNNVREHAYEGRKNQGWWLMALPEKDSELIHFSLADNGRGIPETIQKKGFEHFSLTSKDADLIKAAVSENRSETKLFYRGNGLPKLKTLIDKKMIKNLHIISKKGYYYMDEDKAFQLPFVYHGTIIFWDFIKE